MANNLQILAYIQAMKDEVEIKIEIVTNNNKITDNHNILNSLRSHKQQLSNLEKFIKGGN